MTPLHMAASQGHLAVIKSIISNCPDCYELEDDRGWNKDAKGNTPCHIGAAARRYFVSGLGDRKAVNNQNVSVSDIIKYGYSELEKEIQELSKDVGKGNQYPNGVIRIGKEEKIEDSQKQDKSAEDDKETRASHLVVATLIATVTFAAAFTFPGGYNSEKGQNQGTAILGRNSAFQAFIITDTIAMTLSLSAVFIHLFLSFKGIHKSEDLFRRLLGIALILTMFAMGAMVIAFITGTYAVLAPSLGLAITTCFIGLIFFPLEFYVLGLLLTKAINDMLGGRL
ncbi:protein ACCELERATED CELL DEATH 6-like [Pistacia vera]|uniref:protein ACCELERATED CELL DEATH 6-like n=1 Tax=Pistacia vera TaxID=55513 RepID=UPI0012630F0A|nr:protein ACCELERATED CELL DEATH 6-like [Pistacia vera]